MLDRYGREITYARISVTSACNLRCQYCMPESGCNTAQNLLSDLEIFHICRALYALGIRRFRLTGGEPLCRANLPALAAQLAALAPDSTVTLTTNGILLADMASTLFAAGIRAVNVSLDALDADAYSRVTRGGTVSAVLAGIAAAKAVGMQVKLNVVPLYGINDTHLADFVRFGREQDLLVRFIELMPIGCGKDCQGMPLSAILQELENTYGTLTPQPAPVGHGPAQYYQGADGSTFGIIAAMHAKFCAACNRIRLTADGCLRPCLGQESSVSLRPVLEKDAASLQAILSQTIFEKPSGHAFSAGRNGRCMYQIGG